MATKLAALLAAFVLAAPPTATASYPTFRNAHVVAHLAFDNYAATLDGAVIVGPCIHRGHNSTVCRLRIAGPVAQRYRIIITTANENYTIRARPLSSATPETSGYKSTER